jgi:glucan phosphoethanolaminetransferase (alkaline phosphatase superfamily)
MTSSTIFLLAADALLLLHILFVAFVVCGLLLVFIGKAFRWSWVRNPWFRVAHLVAIGVVVVQSWLVVICPLTSIESLLRSRAGGIRYSGSFMSHWLETVLYYQAPPWVFVLCYTTFGVAVVAGWFWVRPRPFTPPVN